MNRRIAIGVALLLLLATVGKAQEKASPEKGKLTPLRVQVVFSEYEGEKKVSSIPYTLSVSAPEERRGDYSKIRVGVRVPIAAQTKEGGLETRYHELGTDIDSSAHSLGEGRFQLNLSVRRSFLYSPAGKAGELMPSGEPIPSRPIFREFHAQFSLVLKDGQGSESTLATDPVSGRVMKVDVTMTVVK